MKNAFRFLLALAALSLSPLSADPADQKGITGHIFKFDGEKKTFELLKETEYDPITETARSRLTVHWTEDTKFSKVSSQADFSGLKPPLTAFFEAKDASNAEALTQGKPFIAAIAHIYGESIKAPPVVRDGKLKEAGLFTPSTGDNPHQGIFEVEGRKIPVSLRKGVTPVIVHGKLAPADLERGFWQTTIHGEETDGRFVIHSMVATPLPDPLATDDTKLPRVLIIGDSISMNYFEAAKAELKGIANLHRNEGNAGPSSRGVSNTELWLGDYTGKGRHWDVIQFNHGLHDLKQVYDKKTDTFGAYSVPIEEYQANLEKQIAILKKTGAKLIWCATTPVPNDNKSQYARRKGASIDFNKAALDVMAKHPEIYINDLHATVTNSPVFDNWRKTIDVHFYKEEETQALGKAVAAVVKKALEKPSKKLPLPGETFSVNGRTAFLILPETRPPGRPTPWIWYAPTLPNLPANEEKWMFEKFLEKGIAIAGIDVGESMGNPAGVADYSALHDELVTNHGMSKTPSLLARSRGGLMLYNWAVTHPESVSAIAGIYPVGNLASYPGLVKAAPAYGFTTDELTKRLTEFNPVSRLAPLAKAKVPIMHLHGDNDKVVPNEKNSGLIKEQYGKLGGEMKLELIKGGGHDMNPHWFQSQALVDFLIKHAK